MAGFDKRKVFISWSKTPADEVALAFKSLLLHMFDNVEPWVSSDGISAGSLGVSEIHRQLADTTFGVLIVTTQNQREPWLNYEAGSLAKTVGVEGGQTQVVPLLIDMDHVGQLEPGPIANLQALVADEEGVRRVVVSIGRAVSADPSATSSRWTYGWSRFEAVLASARERLSAEQPEVEPRTIEDMLEELLALSRTQTRVFTRSEPVTPFAVSRAEEKLRFFMRELDHRNILAKYLGEHVNSRGSIFVKIALLESPGPEQIRDLQAVGSLTSADPPRVCFVLIADDDAVADIWM